MKIMMPFWQLARFDRYVPQMKAIAKRIDEFHIAYIGGDVVEDWREYFEFHKVSIPYSFIRSITIRWWLSKGKMYGQLKDIDVDLYYTLSDFWSQEVARHIALKLSKPYVVRLRGNYKDSREARKVPYHKKKFLSHYETRSLRDANLVIPISSRLTKFAQECRVAESRVTEAIPIGVDVKHFRPMVVERKNGFTVGYAGRISSEKGVLRLVEVARKLPRVQFLIAGKREMKVDFPDNVSYMGKLPFNEMPYFYNQCDLVTLPSLTEGFPCVILEAYACGKPILATFEAVPDELKVFGAVGDTDSFPELIEGTKTWSLQSLGKQARKYVTKNYSWEKFGDSIVKCLEEVE